MAGCPPDPNTPNTDHPINTSIITQTVPNNKTPSRELLCCDIASVTKRVSHMFTSINNMTNDIWTWKANSAD